MSPRALSHTRIALGLLMATATVATTGIAGTLALSRSQATRTETAGNPHQATTAPATAGTGFSPAANPTHTPQPSHTRTKGS